MKNKLNTLLLAAILAISFIGCSARQAPVPSPVPRQQGYTTKVPGDMLKVIDKNIVPPKQLSDMGSNTLGLMNDAKAGDWNKAASKISLIRKDYNTLNPMLQVSATSKKLINDIGGTVGSLEKQVNAKNAYETRMEANKLTKYVLDAEDMYKATLPTDIGKIGYHTRQIVLEAEKGKWTEAKSNYDSAASLWTSLKAKLNTTYNSDITKLSSAMNALKKSIEDKSASTVNTDIKRLNDNLSIIKSDLQKQNGLK